MNNEDKYNKIQMLINWDRNPETEKGARQVIHSTVSRELPVGDYNVYVGKVIEKIYMNEHNNLVLCLRLPEEQDLSPENLNRRPLTESTMKASDDEIPQTILQHQSREEFLKMKQDMIQAEQAYLKSSQNNRG